METYLSNKKQPEYDSVNANTETKKETMQKI